jgi:hypothetical protein
MTRRADPDDIAADVFELWSAETAKELRRVLVMHLPGRRSADAFEPFLLLSKHHEIDPAGSAETAMLLVTDPRWRDGVGNLVRQIEESGILDEDHLDLLAEAFLAAGAALYWQVPDDWFSEEGIVIQFGEVDDTAEAAEHEEEEVDGPAVARREVFPPLRRWAAGRLVGRQPQRWSQIFNRAGELDARAAAPVIAGLLDVIDVLGPPTQELLIEEATRWPNHSVRRLALGLVVERKGTEAAHAIAKADPNASLRRWADSLVNPRPAKHGRTAQTQRPEAPKVEAPEPPTLF